MPLCIKDTMCVFRREEQLKKVYKGHYGCPLDCFVDSGNALYTHTPRVYNSYITIVNSSKLVQHM